MSSKVAIFDNDKVLKFLNNADNQVNQVRAFMPLAFGMHLENMRKLIAGDDNTKGDVITKKILEFSRAKNRKKRRELLSDAQAEVIWKVAKRGKLKISNQGYDEIFTKMGNIITEYPTPPVTQMTLRHTFVLNQLREHWGEPDKFDLVVKKVGCTREVVAQNYLDLDQWTKLNKREFQEPLDLMNFKFMEY